MNLDVSTWSTVNAVINWNRERELGRKYKDLGFGHTDFNMPHRHSNKRLGRWKGTSLEGWDIESVN